MMNENLRLRQTLPSFNDIKKKEEEELFERKNRVRKKLLEEIANTESDYVRDIQVLINGYFKSIKAEKLVDEATIKNLFSNISEILPVNQKLKKLIDEQKNASKDGIFEVGEIFMQIVTHFHILSSNRKGVKFFNLYRILY